MKYSFNKDYSSLSSIHIPLDVYDITFNKILGENAVISTSAVYTTIGGIYAIPNFASADPTVSDTNFFIDFGDGTIVENELSAFHTYKVPGNYQVTLVTTNSADQFFRSTNNHILNVKDPVPDKIFLNQDTGQQRESEGTEKFYLTRFNSIITSQELSANDYKIKLSVDNNTSNVQFADTYLDNENFQYQNKSFFFTSPDKDFEIIDSIKTDSTLIYGKLDAGNLKLSTVSASDTVLVGTSGSAIFRYFEPVVLFDELKDPRVYSLSANTYSVNEGQSVTVRLSTQNVGDDVTVPYNISGTIGQLDIVESFTGFFTMNDSTDEITINIKEDFHTEGSETLVVSLDNLKSEVTIDVNDTSLSFSASIGGLTLDNSSNDGQAGTFSTYSLSLSNESIDAFVIYEPAPTFVSGGILTFNNSSPDPYDIINHSNLTLNNYSNVPGDHTDYNLTLSNYSNVPGKLYDYNLTLSNYSRSPELPEKYSFTLNNSSLVPGDHTDYNLTLNNDSLVPGNHTNYNLTLNNDSLVPGDNTNYNLTLNNASNAPDIHTDYNLTLNNASNAPDIHTDYNLTLNNYSVNPIAV